MPKIIMVNQVLKKMTKDHRRAKAITEIASKVEKPPWNTLDPIWLMALDTL